MESAAGLCVPAMYVLIAAMKNAALEKINAIAQKIVTNNVSISLLTTLFKGVK